MWQITFSSKSKKELLKIDFSIQKQILNFLNEEKLKISPKSSGKALVGNFKGLWRYRVGDYRIICEIKNKELIVLVISIGHRSRVY